MYLIILVLYAFFGNPECFLNHLQLNLRDLFLLVCGQNSVIIITTVPLKVSTHYTVHLSSNVVAMATHAPRLCVFMSAFSSQWTTGKTRTNSLVVKTLLHVSYV